MGMNNCSQPENATWSSFFFMDKVGRDFDTEINNFWLWISWIVNPQGASQNSRFPKKCRNIQSWTVFLIPRKSLFNVFSVWKCCFKNPIWRSSSLEKPFHREKKSRKRAMNDRREAWTVIIQNCKRMGWEEKSNNNNNIKKGGDVVVEERDETNKRENAAFFYILNERKIARRITKWRRRNLRASAWKLGSDGGYRRTHSFSWLSAKMGNECCIHDSFFGRGRLHLFSSSYFPNKK